MTRSARDEAGADATDALSEEDLALDEEAMLEALEEELLDTADAADE